jgi:hypothetical protein
LADTPIGRSSRSGLVATPDRHGRPRRFLIFDSAVRVVSMRPLLISGSNIRVVSTRPVLISGSNVRVVSTRPLLISGSSVRVVSIDMRRSPVPDTAIAPGERPRPGSIAPVWIIAVGTAEMASRPTIAPFDKFAFGVATLINKAWSRAAAPVGTGIGTIIGIAIVTGLRGCQEQTEQCEDACCDQCQSAACRQAGGTGAFHCDLQHARADRAMCGKQFDQSATGRARNHIDKYTFAPSGQRSLRAILRRARRDG